MDYDLADTLFASGQYGRAKNEYMGCLIKNEEYQPTNKQKIDYLKDMISECDKKLSEKIKAK